MSGVDDEQKAKDLYRRYSANPWFLAGYNLYKRFASVKGFSRGILSRWNGFFRRCLGRIFVIALSAILICASSFAPIDTKGWSNVRRAYAVVGVDDVLFGTIVAGLLISTGAFVASQSGVSYAGIADDFCDWAADSPFVNTVWEHGSEWVNPTASGSGSGYTIDVSQVPDSVLKGVMDYGAHLTNPAVSVGVVPSVVSVGTIGLSVKKQSDSDSSANIPANQICTFRLSETAVSNLSQYVESYPYFFVALNASAPKPNNGKWLSQYVGLCDKPVHASYDGQTYRLYSDSDAQCVYTSDSTGNVICYENFSKTFNRDSFSVSNTFPTTELVDSSCCVWFATSAVMTASPIAAGVPDAISNPIDAYQADPTDENAQNAIDAIRAANPSVVLPETAPQVVNNYNDYVTVNNGSGEVVDPDVPSEFDLTGLADAIAQALGGGATIASVLAALRSILDGMVTSDALAGEFAGIDALLRQLVNLEQRAEEWRQQQQLNADLDEIIRLLTSIDENVSAILGDMANLDRSTGDLVNLQPVIDAINALQIPGDPVATDLSSLEHQMLDMTDEDGVTLTVHGLLHWINYYLQDIDRFLHEWNPYEPIDYSTVLGNIYDEVSAFTDTFTQFWEDFDNYLDAVLWDLEHLQLAPRTPHAPYPTPLPNPETGIVPWEDMLNLNALRDAITRMMQKFPFATINNFVLILTMLVRPAQAPQFDLPLPNPSDWSDPYMVHVDLSIWDVPAAVLRTGTMLWAIARVSRRTVALWTSEEGGGEGA